MARMINKQCRLTEWAAKRVAALSEELRTPQATLLRLMVVDFLTDTRRMDALRDRFLGNRLPFEEPSKPKKGRRR